MFPQYPPYYRRARSHGSHDMSSATSHAHEMSAPDPVVPSHGRGLTQFGATGRSSSLCGEPQIPQHLIDAQIAQFCTVFDPCPSNEILSPSEISSSPQVNGPTQNPPYDTAGVPELHGDAVQNAALEPVFSEQQPVPSLSRGSSTTPSYSPVMSTTPVDETSAGPPKGFHAETRSDDSLTADRANIEEDPLLKGHAADDNAYASTAPQPAETHVAGAFDGGAIQHSVTFQPITTPSNFGNFSQFPPESDGFCSGVRAHNLHANSRFSMSSSPDASAVDYRQQSVPSNALTVQYAGPEPVQAVPPSYSSISRGVAINVVDAVVSTSTSTESNALGSNSSGRKRRRSDATISNETAANGHNARNGRGCSKKPKYKLVLVDGRPVKALEVAKIREVLGLRAVNPPDEKIKCVIPGCDEMMLEPELLKHFKGHCSMTKSNVCPVYAHTGRICKKPTSHTGCSENQRQKPFSNAAALGKHLRDVHLDARALKCTVCGGMINRDAADQIRRHLGAMKHAAVWPQLGLRLVKNDDVSDAEADDGLEDAHGSDEDDKGEGSSNRTKRQRCI